MRRAPVLTPSRATRHDVRLRDLHRQAGFRTRRTATAPSPPPSARRPPPGPPPASRLPYPSYCDRSSSARAGRRVVIRDRDLVAPATMTRRSPCCPPPFLECLHLGCPRLPHPAPGGVGDFYPGCEQARK